MSFTGIRKAFQDEKQRGKIIGTIAVAVEFLLLFWLFPRLAWVNGSYTACAETRWSPALGEYACMVPGTKELWDYTPTFLSTDWNLTHLTALLALAILNVLAICAYGLYSRFGQEVSYWITDWLRALDWHKRSRQDEKAETLNT